MGFAAPVLGGIGPLGEKIDEVAIRTEALHGRTAGPAGIVAEQGAALDRPRVLNAVASLGKAQPSHAVGGACVRFLGEPIVFRALGAEGVEPVPECGQVHQFVSIIRIPLVDGVRFVAGGLNVDVVVRIDAAGEVQRISQRSSAPEAGERLVAEVLGRHAACVGEEVRLLVDSRVQHPCRPATGGGRGREGNAHAHAQHGDEAGGGLERAGQGAGDGLTNGTSACAAAKAAGKCQPLRRIVVLAIHYRSGFHDFFLLQLQKCCAEKRCVAALGDGGAAVVRNPVHLTGHRFPPPEAARPASGARG